MDEIAKLTAALIGEVDALSVAEKVESINLIRMELHKISPFKNEPVDCVQWISLDGIEANDYNPNKVAPPEMRLLEHSIREDGYTQPIVAWPKNGNLEVIDGFHRNRVGREIDDIKTRIHGYLPVSIINPSRTKRRDRIAATIRHNRARGKHTVDGMSDIVLELKNRNWKDERIARELGMEQDEILRLCQITGLAGLFSDQEFSKSWDVEESAEDFVELEDNASAYDHEAMVADGFRTVNTEDRDRIFHEWKKWECYKAGFYSTTFKDKDAAECEKIYFDFLSDLKQFEKSLKKVISEWKYSCEHYLSNVAMNRIAWLGQASVCYTTGVPSKYRNGFNFLSLEQQEEANNLALIYLNKWLKKNGRDEVDMDEAMGQKRQMDLY